MESGSEDPETLSTKSPIRHRSTVNLLHTSKEVKSRVNSKALNFMNRSDLELTMNRRSQYLKKLREIKIAREEERVQKEQEDELIKKKEQETDWLSAAR